MTGRLLTLALIAGSLPAQEAFDARIAQMLPSDAAIVIGLNWKQMVQSPGAKSFQQQIQAAMPMMALQSGLRDFQDFVMNDLESVLVALPAASATQLTNTKKGAAPPPMLILMRGRFNLAKIRQWGNEKKGETELYKEYELLKAGKPPMRAAVLDGGTMIVGSRKDVVAAIERRSRPAAQPVKMASRLEALAATNDFFLLANVPPAAFKGNPGQPVPPMLAAFQDLSGFDLGISMQQGMAVRANLTAKTDESAKALASTLQTLIAMGAQSSKDPQAAEMARRLSIAPAGRYVAMGLTITQAELDAMVKEQVEKTAQRAPASGPPRISGPGEVTVQAPAAGGQSTGKSIRITGLDGGPVELPAGEAKK